MRHLERFEEHGRVMDDLLMAAYKLPPARFTEPGPAGEASLRDLCLAWLEEQRRAVHGSLLGRTYTPLPLAAHGGVFDVGRAFGGFRLTLRDQLEALTPRDLERRVPWTDAAGARSEITIERLLAHLLAHGADLERRIADRLRALGA